MSFHAVCDGQTVDSFLTKLVGPSSAYTVTAVVSIPAATHAALVASALSSSAEMVMLGDPNAGHTGIYSSPHFNNWRGDGAVPVGPGPAAVTKYELKSAIAFVSGHTWSVVRYVDGVLLFPSVNRTFPNTSAQQLLVNAGAIFGQNVSPETYNIHSVEVRDSGGSVIFFDDFSSGDGSAWGASTGSITYVADPVPTPPVTNGGVKVSIAFTDATLEPDPTWTDVTALSSSLVASYSIDRGRSLEFDPTDPATTTVTLNDRSGLFDPTNSHSPLTGTIEPDMQIKIELWNPVAKEWQMRFRGWVEDYDYDQDGSQKLSTVTITCYDIFALMARIEMQPGVFGDTPPVDGVVFFDNATFQDRITQVFGNAGIGTEFFVAFTGNVNLLEQTCSPGDNPMDVVQAAVDAEFPGVANAYVDRFGRSAAHGRLAVFDPEGTAASTTPDVWEYVHWKCGDGKAVAASPGDTAHIRPPYKFNRGISEIINSATASPQGIDQADIAAQLVEDAVSIGLRGIKSWSRQNLLVDNGILTGNSGKDECKLFATFYVTNYKDPRNRITELTVKSITPGAPGSATTWDLLCRGDISHRLDVTVDHPKNPAGGGGGFDHEPFYIQGIKETAVPLNGEYAMVTTTYEISPKALFDDPVGLDGS